MPNVAAATQEADERLSKSGVAKLFFEEKGGGSDKLVSIRDLEKYLLTSGYARSRMQMSEADVSELFSELKESSGASMSWEAFSDGFAAWATRGAEDEDDKKDGVDFLAYEASERAGREPTHFEIFEDVMDPMGGCTIDDAALRSVTLHQLHKVVDHRAWCCTACSQSDSGHTCH